MRPFEGDVAFPFITARKRSWGKVIFLHLSVILFTGGVPGRRGAWSGGVPGPGGVPGGDPPEWLLLRAVRILLECILVQV